MASIHGLSRSKDDDVQGDVFQTILLYFDEEEGREEEEEEEGRRRRSLMMIKKHMTRATSTGKRETPFWMLLSNIHSSSFISSKVTESLISFSFSKYIYIYI